MERIGLYIPILTALIKSTLTNISKLPIDISLQWKGHAILAEGLKLSSEDHQLNIHSSKSKAIGHILYQEGTVIKNNDNVYSALEATEAAAHYKQAM